MMETHIKTISSERRAVMFARIEEKAAGFRTGTGSPNRAFVFFDPHCSHCGDLWKATQALKNQVDFVWVPVTVFGEESAALGAVILEADNPASLMSANAEAMEASGAPMTMTLVPSEASLSKVANNTELMFGLDPSAPIQAVPLTYYKSAKGNIELISGSLDTGALKAALRPD